MSFDTEFDYTNAKDHLDNRITTYNGQISIYQDQANVIANISGHSSLVSAKQADITGIINSYNNLVAEAQSVKDEILNVESLGTDDKIHLYDFWGNVLSGTNETRGKYMQRMLFNYQGLITEANVLMSDGALTTNEKQMLAAAICQNYPIYGKVSKVGRYMI